MHKVLKLIRASAICSVTLLLPLAASARLSFDLGKLLQAPNKIQSATTELPEDQEIELGRSIAARLIGAMPLVRDDAVQRHVNDVGWWLVSHTEKRGLP
jgi:predicted Zn-dependent protease